MGIIRMEDKISNPSNGQLMCFYNPVQNIWEDEVLFTFKSYLFIPYGNSAADLQCIDIREGNTVAIQIRMQKVTHKQCPYVMVSFVVVYVVFIIIIMINYYDHYLTALK
uniref:Uncharacterized protein n=1 Tax=Glossina brevipalpis TaxID=37001 RepID=A0A1A9WC41_9MUSC